MKLSRETARDSAGRIRGLRVEMRSQPGSGCAGESASRNWRAMGSWGGGTGRRLVEQKRGSGHANQRSDGGQCGDMGLSARQFGDQ